MSDDRTRSHDTTVADGDAREHRDARAKPDIVTDADGFGQVAMLPDETTERRHGVICRNDPAMHADEGVVADVDTAVSENDRVLSEVAVSTEDDVAAIRVQNDSLAELAFFFQYDAAHARCAKTELKIDSPCDDAGPADASARATREGYAPSGTETAQK